MTIANKFIKRTASTLSTIIGYIRTGSGYLSPKDDWVEGLKRRLVVAVDPFTRPLGHALTFECHSEDYITTAEADSDTVEVGLMSRYQRNLTSTKKFRAKMVLSDGTRQWAVGSFVYDPDDTEWQHHVYLFDSPTGGTDLYGHKETSAETDPYGHVNDKQTHGDPDGLARGELEAAGVAYA